MAPARVSGRPLGVHTDRRRWIKRRQRAGKRRGRPAGDGVCARGALFAEVQTGPGFLPFVFSATRSLDRTLSKDPEAAKIQSLTQLLLHLRESKFGAWEAHKLLGEMTSFFDQASKLAATSDCFRAELNMKFQLNAHGCGDCQGACEDPLGWCFGDDGVAFEDAEG